MTQNFNYQEELSKCKSMQDITGKDGLIQKIIRDAVEHVLGRELENYISKEKENGNNVSRNGTTNKNIKTAYGNIGISVPRTREPGFEPEIVKKRAVVEEGLESQVISMYAKGDAVHFKVREEGRIVTKAAYAALGINGDGYKDILGIWIGENEGAKFWLKVCNELKNRGVEDILIACIDGLRGFADAIHTVFPQTRIQLCIIHQIRNTIKYVSYKDQREFLADLKKVYGAESEEIALAHLESMQDSWKKYGAVLDSWIEKWDNLSTYFCYGYRIRRLIYTTNTIEGFNRQLRKVTKNKAVFPTDDSLRKTLYLCTRDIVKKWSMPYRDWGETYGQFVIEFGDRAKIA